MNTSNHFVHRKFFLHTFQLAVVGLAAVGLNAISSGVFVRRAHATTSEEEPQSLMYQLGRVLAIIEQAYVEPVDRQRLLQGAIKGMVAELDPHSSFMTASEYREFASDSEGQFAGIGIEVDGRDEILTVVAPLPGSPAEKAGIRPKDRIIRVENEEVTGQGLDKLVRRMRGLPGTKVQLWVRRPGEPKVLSFEIVREIVHVAAVTSKVLDGRVGYIRIKQFQERTHKEFLDAIVRLREELKGPLAGVLLDLRSNPGGLVDEAAAVADEFLSAGTVFTIRHRGQVMDEVHAHRGGALEGIPVVALVDSWSASASELLVGALQDHGRAVVVGMPTFGKGSVQSVVGLPGGAGLKITTARYYSPKGRALQARGIAPDVVVERPVAPGDMPPLRESDLEGALSEERSAPSVAPARVVQGQDDGQALAMDVREMPSNPLLSKDPTLREGYKLLRERKAPGP